MGYRNYFYLAPKNVVNDIQKLDTQKDLANYIINSNTEFYWLVVIIRNNLIIMRGGKKGSRKGRERVLVENEDDITLEVENEDDISLEVENTDDISSQYEYYDDYTLDLENY